ncbi:hypothetical protein MKEN_00736700 [Mycena kentingensis (nom. inval.)]|nr:hypothetical protein MKEN_00736700 [Mycena kentingensis (nom. inval.)]
MTSATPLTTLPPEVCGTICGLTDKPSLIALATVSRPFRHEAQRIIFRTVDLGNTEAARQWRLAIRRNPRLSPIATRISFSMPRLADAELLAKALKKCKNLKHLEIRGDNAVSTHTWIAEGSFKLRVFVNSALGLAPSSPFWKQQTQIRVLSFPLSAGQYIKGGFPCGDDKLPNLVAVDVVDMGMLPATTRPLERIQLNMAVSLIKIDDLTGLARFAPTLTHLNLTGVLFEYLECIVPVLVKTVPNLVHLGVSEPIEQGDPFYLSDVRPGVVYLPLHVMRAFAHLRSLVLFAFRSQEFLLPDVDDVPEQSDYPFYVMLNDPKGVAHTLMDDVSQLRLVTIASSIQNERTKGFTLGTDVPERTVRTCTLRRLESEDSKQSFSVDRDGEYDFDAVGHFWEA